MSILSEDELRQALTRAEMAESVELPIEEYRDLVYQALSAIAAESELEAVRKRTIEAEKDAERYRWLRDHYRWAEDSMNELWFSGDLKVWFSGDLKAPCMGHPYPDGIIDSEMVDQLRGELDRAIDQARSLLPASEKEKSG